MPIFEYQCKSCGHRFERIVFRAVDEIVCPQCQHRETERLISTFSVSANAGRSQTGRAGGDCAPGGIG